MHVNDVFGIAFAIVILAIVAKALSSPNTSKIISSLMGGFAQDVSAAGQA